MSYSQDWCTKKQVSRIIGRTERTVSRIVRDAVDNRTADILANLKLVYANGKELAGPDVTRDLIAQNEKEGSRTRWFFNTSWWRDDYALRINNDEAADGQPTEHAQGNGDAGSGKTGRATSPGSPPPLPSDLSIRAIVLEHLHFNDQKHAAELKDLTQRVLQVVETNQQLQGQTNTLFNQFQDAISAGGGLRALVDRPAAPPPAGKDAAPPAEVDEAIVVEAVPPASPSNKTGSAARTKKPAKAPKKEGAKTHEAGFAARHLPTLAKLFTRRS